MNRNRYEYRPDYAVPPGETLREMLETLQISQTELAGRMGRPIKTINEISLGKTAITPETALQLERVLGVPASFWNTLERNYQDALVRQQAKLELKEAQAWLRGMPVRDMQRLGWLPRIADKLELANLVFGFFGVASVAAWHDRWANPQAAYRTSRLFRQAPENVATWLRKGEIEAGRVECLPFCKDQFKAALQSVHTLMRLEPELWAETAKETCRQAGVAVVFVEELPKCPSGATRWLSRSKALIQLSLRYRSDDQLWFTFFHEAGHLLLHGKRKVFIEDCSVDTEEERQASRFAEELLIPGRAWNPFVAQAKFQAADIMQFADRVGVPPGIVVGRLQHSQLLRWDSSLNRLKRRLRWERCDSGHRVTIE